MQYLSVTLLNVGLVECSPCLCHYRNQHPTLRNVAFSPIPLQGGMYGFSAKTGSVVYRWCSIHSSLVKGCIFYPEKATLVTIGTDPAAKVRGVEVAGSCLLRYGRMCGWSGALGELAAELWLAARMIGLKRYLWPSSCFVDILNA